MADERRPSVWGLWNPTIGEWFNPGTRKPYFATPEAAQRLIPLVLRQYPIGKWEVREYPLEAEERAAQPAEPQESAVPPPGRHRLEGV